MALKLITPPAVEPVTLTEIKTHMRVETDAENSYIVDVLIPAAREYCEDVQKRAFITQTWQLWLYSWPEDKTFIKIPRPPLQSIDSIKYYSTDNTEYTMDVADYFVDNKNEPGRVVLAYQKTWPSETLRPANGVCITFTAGYGDTASAVPKKVFQAMQLLVGYWYENREAAITGKVSKEIEFAVNALLWQDRILDF